MPGCNPYFCLQLFIELIIDLLICIFTWCIIGNHCQLCKEVRCCSSLSPAVLAEALQLDRVFSSTGTRAYLGDRFEEFNSLGVRFRLGLADILHYPSFLGNFTPFPIYILFIGNGFCSLVFYVVRALMSRATLLVSQPDLGPSMAEV